jgi:riboflavin kinase/FMN adenylyltransferase
LSPAVQTVRGTRALAPRPSATSVAIGNFDGVHRGHQELLHQAAAHAGSGILTTALTFDPHPARVLSPAKAPPLICPLGRRLELFAAAGVELAVVEPFDTELASHSPEAFVDEVLVAGLAARHVVVGWDFTFGFRRGGTVETLRELGSARNFGVTVVPAIEIDGGVVSSTRIRQLIKAGDLPAATRLLGRPPEVEGVVVRGAERGRTLGFPTANIAVETEVVPPEGVYAGWARLADGRRFMSAVSVGTNSTFGNSGGVTTEAYLLDADVDLYGQRLRLELGFRLRDQERFSSVEALVAQIRQDVAATRQLCEPA